MKMKMKMKMKMGKIFFLCLLGASLAFVMGAASSDDPMVSTRLGPVRGKKELSHGVTVYSFKGIPYAKAPKGDLRWAPPQDHDPWSPKTQDATSYGKICPQVPLSKGINAIAQQFNVSVRTINNLGEPKPPQTQEVYDEDCLFINVYSGALPGDNSDSKVKRPVMVMIHEGGLDSRSGNNFPSHSLIKQGTVYVTFNYRLGVLGFMSHPALKGEANFGFQDQVKALQWVQDNIAAFGGDPDQVTIFGESSGGTSVAAHLLSPKSEGLFHAAIAESPAIFQDSANATAHQAASVGSFFGSEALGQAFDKSDPMKQLEMMRDVDAVHLIGNYSNWINSKNPHLQLYSGLLREIVRDDAGGFMKTDILQGFLDGDNKKVPTIIGSNADEINFFEVEKPTSPLLAPYILFADREPVKGLTYLLSLPINSTKKYRATLAALFGEEGAEEVMQLLPAKTDADVEKQVWRLTTLLLFNYYPYAIATAMAGRGEDVRQYYFNHSSPHQHQMGHLAGAFGAMHGAEFPYVVNSNQTFNKQFEIPIDDNGLAALMNAYWTNFAKTGNPNGEGLPAWEITDGKAFQVFNTTSDVSRKAIPSNYLEFFNKHASVMASKLANRFHGYLPADIEALDDLLDKYEHIRLNGSMYL
mmetsp:Transcript_7912/g.21519  ORF Transcript_7912/g.21519 Transcript_7912/m.21519 type:complete len:640 (+) Transcript_7912:225-2144(+)